MSHRHLSRATPQPGWARQLARRWRHRQLLKTAGICAFTALFFVAYFHLLRNPSREPWVVPLTSLDPLIAYHPGALWPYLSLWVYVGVPAAVMPSVGVALRFAGWAAALCVTGLLCFWLWPTVLPPSWVPGGPADNAGLALLRGLDAPGNACPSLHVACAVFSALWIDRQLAALGAPAWPRLVSAAWLLAIVWSTVALRQHVLIDVVAGTALGALFGAASLRWGPHPDGGAPDRAGDAREL